MYICLQTLLVETLATEFGQFHYILRVRINALFSVCLYVYSLLLSLNLKFHIFLIQHLVHVVTSLNNSLKYFNENTMLENS